MRHEWECEDASGEKLIRAVDSEGFQWYRYYDNPRHWYPTSGDAAEYGAEILRLSEENRKQHLALLNYEGIKRQNEARIAALEAEVKRLRNAMDTARRIRSLEPLLGI